MDLFTPSFFLSIGIFVLLLSMLAIFLLRRIQVIHDETVMAFDLVTITAKEVSAMKQFLVLQQQQQHQQQQQNTYPITVDEEEIEDDDDEDEDEDDEEHENDIKIIILSDPTIDIVAEDIDSISDDHDIEELDDMEIDLKESVAAENIDIDESVKAEVEVEVAVDYRTLKLPELRKFASEHGITHVHNMKKNEIVVAIEQLGII